MQQLQQHQANMGGTPTNQHQQQMHPNSNGNGISYPQQQQTCHPAQAIQNGHNHHHNASPYKALNDGKTTNI